MPNETKIQLREEWKDKFYERFGGEGSIAKTDENCILIGFTKKEVINFIDDLLKSQRDSLVEKVLKIIDNNDPQTDNKVSPRYWGKTLRKEILSIIKEGK